MESKEAEHELQLLIKSGALSEADQFVIATWTRQVMFHGPESLLIDPKWADHELYEKWKGYRSSSFSTAGRIIYCIEDKIIRVKVARITTDHNYKKEKTSEVKK
jgi:mRNA-degrading endonuclease YafQ of YafQ-DinJ toxin-antitoxin module